MEDHGLLRRIAFAHIKGIDLDKARHLADITGGVDAFFDMPVRQLWQLIGAQKEFCSDSARAHCIDSAAAELPFLAKNSVDALFYDNQAYPHRLLECDDAPALLYRLGRCDLNARHVVSIVGTRRATAYGCKFTADLVAALAERLEGLVIVSGLAYGIDVAAHQASLKAGVPTVAVVAHGLRTLYPADHRDIARRIVSSGGAIVTEYPSAAPVHRGNFLARNRIVAGMADALVMVESDAKGGAMVTASIAAAYNRDVFAVPGRVTDRYSRGANALIHNNKAAMLRDADDLIEAMNWQTRPTPGEQTSFDFAPAADPQLTPGQQLIVDHLRRNPDDTLADIANALTVPYRTIAARVMEMEMDDILAILPGGAIQLNI